MAAYHILKVIIISVIPENLVLLTKSEQSGPKSAHIRPTICLLVIFSISLTAEFYLQDFMTFCTCTEKEYLWFKIVSYALVKSNKA